MTHLEHCTRAVLAIGKNKFDSCEAAAVTQLEHNWNIARGLASDWQEQACLCEAVAMTHLEHCKKGFLAIGKNILVYARMTHLEHCTEGFLAIGKNKFDHARP